MGDKIELAKQYCTHYHDGQFRKGSSLPYHTHPFAVADILARYGYDDAVTQCIAYLHDTVEDTPLRMDAIMEVFGYEIGNGIYILSRNKGKISEGRKLTEEEYKLRLSFARNKIKRVKVADMIHNTSDLESLDAGGIEAKLRDAEGFYIPMGKEICPIMVKELVANVEGYRIKVKA